MVRCSGVCYLPVRVGLFYTYVQESDFDKLEIIKYFSERY